jgi:SSS family solute:Na+ symporter
VGQISTVILVGLALLWIPLMGTISEQIYTYLQSVQAYIAPPIAAVFLLGILWRRVNARGAMASLLTGFVLGMGRLVAELNQSVLEGWLHRFATINFLHFAIALFAVCTAVLVGVSLTAPPPPREQLRDLTFGEVSATGAGESRRARRVNVVLSVLLVLSVVAVWVYFS